MNLASINQSSTIKVAYLRTLPAIRERCSRVHELAQDGKLEYFDYYPDKEQDVINFCEKIIKRDFGSRLESIPPHGRWRHLDSGRPRIENMISQWKDLSPSIDDREICKRLIDLFLVSVLLDAGAGNRWTYQEPGTHDTYARSEGLGVASVHMFQAGFFSGDNQQPYRVDADGLSRITVDRTASALQVTSDNPMTGLEGRSNLLFNLADALRANPIYFGSDARPGNMIDFLESQSILKESVRRVPVLVLWHVLIEGLASAWPSTRTTLDGIAVGDVWPCNALRASFKHFDEGDDLVPFHKLTGWLTYSLLEPLQKILHWQFDGIEDLTGLPEYRNGGLLVDFGVLALKRGVIPSSFYPDTKSGIPKLPTSHPAIVEWRAMTVIELDRIAAGIRSKFGVDEMQLSLAQVLESATWKGGREIAKLKRPENGGPPIDIESDGTVF